MRGLILSVFAFMQVSQEAPQGSLNDLQSGFNRVVTTGEDENAPYTVIQKYDVSLHLHNLCIKHIIISVMMDLNFSKFFKINE